MGTVLRRAVSLACLLLLSGCVAARSTAATHVSAARALCTAPGARRVATASLTTLGAVRAANFGGPYPGLKPGRHLFPGHRAGEAAAWCWSAAPATDASGPSWELRVAISGAESGVLFGMGGGPAPTGAVSVP